jgi:hypothetical protein
LTALGAWDRDPCCVLADEWLKLSRGQVAKRRSFPFLIGDQVMTEGKSPYARAQAHNIVVDAFGTRNCLLRKREYHCKKVLRGVRVRAEAHWSSRSSRRANSW